MNVKQTGKNLLNRFFLPFMYGLFKNKKANKNKIIFADSNTSVLPESMQAVYDECVKRGYDCRLWLTDFRTCGFLSMVRFLMGFMKEYATARAVFVCNYFLPVNSCSKRKETAVVQLWHSCGLLKKFAYDTPFDISPDYKGSVTENFDLFTLSSEACVPVWSKALRLEGDRANIMKPLGVARTDRYFSPRWQNECRERFYAEHPDFAGKKILLWAPTFRGTAGNPTVLGEDEIDNLGRELGDEWALIKKVHPMIPTDGAATSLTASELFPVCDALITDFSSLVCEFAVFKKPILFFAPDYDDFLASRGAYFDPEKDFPYPVVKNGECLKETLCTEIKRYNNLQENDREAFDEFIKIHMGSCDGKSTERILQFLNI